MSWSIEVCGKRNDVLAAIEEAATSSLPQGVASYLKDAVAACAPSGEADFNIEVKSNGHRPMEFSGANETAYVRVVRASPWKPAASK